MACPSCRLDKTESIVHRGSYILRCAACGETIVATSFMAMHDLEHECSAFVDPGPGKRPPPETLIARGPLRLISTAISAVARNRTPVLLISEAKD
ncbi:eukaryotic translation initiation factor eIF-2-beta/eIF-5 family protein [Rhizobium leguminosarum]|uniref:eukaryotic translation initiation factor eIF-2-beta/eIF-5 family protein n=1 Tax=Rhizobium leguminosarum TaxID=384 RepID=UPI001C971577|nr:eukaryotic translation initiation factor eIF-2-beta/eIF-5 family protein [Rhizobium leguminosarum]MBY5404985.1 eukaryotic translation initiation factor eIF-2-beta/eIF-5 family protein [Rhizobium leguminosarum]